MSARPRKALVAVALMLGCCGAAYANPAPDTQQAAHTLCAEFVKEVKSLYDTRTVDTPLLDQSHWVDYMGKMQEQCEAGLNKQFPKK